MKYIIPNCYALCAFMCAMYVHKEVNNQPVSIVLESGQPNVSFVHRILQSMIDANEHGLAAVATARKQDFIELHTSDFISHVASTHDVEWLKRLMKSGRLKHGHFPYEVIAKTSPEIKSMISRARNARRAAKRNR